MISAAPLETALHRRDAAGRAWVGAGMAGRGTSKKSSGGDPFDTAEAIRVDPARTHRASLSQLPPGTRATVTRVVSASQEIDAVALRRLGELGFLPGEPVTVLRRGPGGREPIAVLIGETMFALRLLEAQCVEVSTVVT